MAQVPIGAAAQSWSGADNTDWTNDDNWTPAPFPNDPTATAVIDAGGLANQPVLNDDVTVDLTQVNSGSLTVDAGLTSAEVVIGAAGTVEVTAQGSITGIVTSSGALTNSGTLGDVDVGADATFDNLAGGDAGALTTAGTSSNAEGGTLDSANVTGGTFENAGAITGDLDIADGDVTNTATGSVVSRSWWKFEGGVISG